MKRRSPIPTTLSAGLALCLAALPAQAIAQSDGDSESDAAADGLSGVVWAVTQVGPAPPATEQTVLFEPDGGLVASSGCADYTGTYRIDGEDLVVESMRREFGSLQECTPSEGGSADTFVNLMEAAQSWDIGEDDQLSIAAGGRYEGWTLTLESRGAPEAATDGTDAPYVAASLDDVVGTWRLQTMDLGEAGRATLPDEIDILLTLAPGGTLAGEGSCSDYAGEFTLVGEGGIAITDLDATEPGTCAPEAADLQQFYLGLLPVVDTVEVVDGSLVLGATAIAAEFSYEPAE